MSTKLVFVFLRVSWQRLLQDNNYNRSVSFFFFLSSLSVFLLTHGWLCAEVCARPFFIFARRWRRRRLETWEFRKRRDARLTSTRAEQIVSRICRNVHPSSAGVGCYLMLIARGYFRGDITMKYRTFNSAFHYFITFIPYPFYLSNILTRRGNYLLRPYQYNCN